MVHLIGHLAESGSNSLLLAHYSAQLGRDRVESSYHAANSLGLSRRSEGLLAVILDDMAKPPC